MDDTVDVLVRCSERELLDAEGLGRGAVKAIQEALAQRGLSLRVVSR